MSLGEAPPTLPKTNLHFLKKRAVAELRAAYVDVYIYMYIYMYMYINNIHICIYTEIKRALRARTGLSNYIMELY